ncbi:MAG: hypothetical protein GXO77_12265 [Calditrichaeota bacterium]|nr:hypothetical protein [Calditrichota bacterium]
MKSLCFYITITIFLFLTPACENPFAPGLKPGTGNSSLIVTDQYSPEDVLINFKYAYNFKDSLVYADLLDSSFLFISKNFATEPVTDLTWGRDVDIKTTVGLFRHFQTLNLIWEGTVYSRFLNDQHSLKEIKKVFSLVIDGGREIPTIRGEALFVFKKKQISQKDTTGIWRIIRWEDLSSF